VKSALEPLGWEAIKDPVLVLTIPHAQPGRVDGLYRFLQPAALCDLFLPPNIFQYLLEATNRGKRQKGFRLLTTSDLYKWLGTLIVFMIHKLRTYRSLWATGNKAIHYPFKQRSLPRNRWMWITANLRFDPGTLRDLLTTAWKACTRPGTYLTVDESRIPSHHLSSGKITYNKSKPEIWAAESVTIHDKTTSILLDFTLPKELPKPAALLMLVNRLPPTNRPRHITADSGFGSYGLCCAMVYKGLYGTFNCQSNTTPTELWQALTTGLPQWRSRWATKETLVAAGYYRNARLHIITNAYSVTEGSARVKAQDRNILLEHYDETKRSADQFNHVWSNFHCRHPHKKFLPSLAIGWIEWGLTNAYLAYKAFHPNELSHEKFLWELSAAFLQR
jgi:hypothetical protein